MKLTFIDYRAMRSRIQKSHFLFTYNKKNHDWRIKAFIHHLKFLSLITPFFYIIKNVRFSISHQKSTVFRDFEVLSLFVRVHIFIYQPILIKKILWRQIFYLIKYELRCHSRWLKVTYILLFENSFLLRYIFCLKSNLIKTYEC